MSVTLTVQENMESSLQEVAICICGMAQELQCRIEIEYRGKLYHATNRTDAGSILKQHEIGFNPYNRKDS